MGVSAVRGDSGAIDYLHEHCAVRGVPLKIRLNPMYVAHGTHWARRVDRMSDNLGGLSICCRSWSRSSPRLT